jgi:hypothetical protein
VADQVGCDAARVGAKLIDELGIPEMVEIASLEAVGRDTFIVAAAVIVVRRVERLMQVADEVEEEL